MTPLNQTFPNDLPNILVGGFEESIAAEWIKSVIMKVVKAHFCLEEHFVVSFNTSSV